MKVRIIEWQKTMFIVLGIGYDAFFDPPEVFYAVPLQKSILYSFLSNNYPIIIPLSEAIEITDEKRLKAIYVLFK